MISVGWKLGLLRFWSKSNRIVFWVLESLETAGNINEPLATSFTVVEGADDFTVSNAGEITFKAPTNYQLQNKYALRVISDMGKEYYITIFLIDTLSTFRLDYDTELNYNTRF